MEDLQKGPSLLSIRRVSGLASSSVSPNCVRPSVRPWRIPVHKGRIALTTYNTGVSSYSDTVFRDNLATGTPLAQQAS